MGPRKPAHWPERINASLTLLSARRYLFQEIRTLSPGCTAERADIHRVLGVTSAITIIDDVRVRNGFYMGDLEL